MPGVGRGKSLRQSSNSGERPWLILLIYILVGDIMRGGPAFPRGTAAVPTPRYHAAIGLGLLLELRIGF